MKHQKYLTPSEALRIAEMEAQALSNKRERARIMGRIRQRAHRAKEQA